MLTPRQAVLRLTEAGYTQTDIVSLLAESGVTTSQTTISRIADGKIVKPSYEVGAAIVAVCTAKVGKNKKRKAA